MESSRHAAGFRQILAITIGVPIFVMILCGIALTYITQRQLHQMQSNRTIIDNLIESRKCEKLIVDMETGVRGYKMTGDATFLNPYNSANAQVDADLDDLSRHVNTDEERNEVTHVKELLKEWRDAADKLVQSGKYNTVPPSTLTDALVAKNLMDSIRAELNTVLDDEEHQLVTGRAKLETTKAAWSYGGVTALAIIILLTAIHVWRQMRKLAALYEGILREVATQKERFRVTLASIGDAVIVTDNDGQTTFMNAEAERMTGWPWNEAKGKPLRNIFRIVNEETRRTVDDPVEKVFKEKRIVGLANHTLLLSKNGAEWPIEDSAAPIYNADKKMDGIVLVFHDATEMRRAQRILKTHAEDLEQKVLARTVELQRTINELEAFSYTVSHDLRAPLRAMQGYASVLLEDSSHKWDDGDRELLIRIKKASERLDVLIQDVLTYSKLNKEHQAIQPVNLDRLVQDILSQYPTFQDSRLKIDVRHPLPAVMGHESGLTQVISNLLTNAVKFMPTDRQPEIKVWAEEKDLTIRLWIEDNGIGIDASHHQRIFKMFEQVDGKKFEGTGMGLAIARKAVENMQGWIGLESQLGVGTKMWIELLKARNV